MALIKLFREVLADTQGATAVEYGLIIAMVVIALVASLQSVANEIVSMWGNVETKVTENGTS